MRGGKRAGSGRPKGEPTTTLSFRVPEHLAPEIKVKIKNLIKKLLI